MKPIRKGPVPKLPPMSSDERAIAEAILGAVAEIRSATTRSEILRALETGNVQQALDVIQWQAGQDFLDRHIPSAIRDAYEAGAKAAEENLIKQVGINLSFDITNPRAIDFIRQRAGDLIREWGDSTKEGLRSLIEAAFRDGLPINRLASEIIDSGVGLTSRYANAVERYRIGLEDDPNIDRPIDMIDRMVERYSRRLLRLRAETIARTEVITASNSGQQALWSQAVQQGLLDPAKMMQEWITTLDSRTDDLCEELDGEQVPLGSAFPGGFSGPPAHPNCVPANCRVSPAGRVTAVSERWYEGDMCVILTAAGNKLSCTPNHPILTPGGWVAAGALNVGSHVVSHSIANGTASVDGDHQDVPPMIQEVAEAFRRSSHVRPTPMKVSAPDFHGDGEGSEVAVVWTDSLLRNRLKPTNGEQVSEPTFQVGSLSDGLICKSPGALVFHGEFAPPHGGMGSSDLAQSLLGGHSTPLQAFRFALSSGLEAGLSEMKTDSGSAHTESLGEGKNGSAVSIQVKHGSHVELSSPVQADRRTVVGSLDAGLLQRVIDSAEVDSQLARDINAGTSGPVLLDEIVSIHREPFSGLVMNLETTGRWYEAQGIVSHNCRCSTGLVFQK